MCIRDRVYAAGGAQAIAMLAYGFDETVTHADGSTETCLLYTSRCV